jgi:hypothetical protein
MRFTCPEVFDKDSGRIETADSLLSPPEDVLFRMRRAVEERKRAGRPMYTCPLCARELTLRGGVSDDGPIMHFAHPRDPLHECPYKSGGDHTPDEIARMVYNGLKETRLHRMMKVWIRRSLIADGDAERASICVERRYRARLPDKSFRRPDVSAIWRGTPHVFEAQIASTFVRVITERATFYRRQGAKLLWIFSSWPRELDRFTDKDLYYTNNYNVLVVNEETSRLSVERDAFVLQAWWAVPSAIDHDGKATTWTSATITLADLHYDEKDGGRAYFFDVEGERKKFQSGTQVVHRVAVAVPQAAKGQIWSTSTNLASTSLPSGDSFQLRLTSLFDQAQSGDHIKARAAHTALRKELAWSLESDSTWLLFAEAASQAKLLSSTYARGNYIGEGLALFGALHSLHLGTPCSPWQNLRMIENHMHKNYPRHYSLFLHAVRTYGREAVLDAEKPSSTVYKHIHSFRDSQYRHQQERAYDSMVLLLFPELKDAITLLQRISYDRLAPF